MIYNADIERNKIMRKMNNEILRNNMLTKIKMICNLPVEKLMMIEQIMIEEMQGLTINQEETQIVVRNNENEQLLNLFVMRKQFSNLSDGSIRNYRNLITKFIEWLPKSLKEVVGDDIRMFLSAYRRMRGISECTMDNYRLTFSTFFSFLHDNGYILLNPMASFDPIKYKQKLREPLTHLEVEKVRRVLRDDIREEAIFEMFYSTGCRVSEVVNMNLSDINFDEGTIKVCGKGDKERFVMLTDRAKLALFAYLEQREDRDEHGVLASDAVFVNSKGKHVRLGKATFETIIRNVCKRAGITRKITPHVLRHTFATHFLENSSIEVVQEVLGHVKTDTTKIYAKISLGKIKNDFARGNL